MSKEMLIVYIGKFRGLFLELKIYIYRIRREIYEEAFRRSANYPNITLNSEIGPMNILDYISNNTNKGFYGGELELSIASELYNINIGACREIHENNNFIGLSYVGYYNSSNNTERHLMILTNINGNILD